MRESILLARHPITDEWHCYLGDESSPYIAHAWAISDVLTMIECRRMGEIPKASIKRLHFFLACYGEPVRFIVAMTGERIAYIAGKDFLKLDLQ